MAAPRILHFLQRPISLLVLGICLSWVSWVLLRKPSLQPLRCLASDFIPFLPPNSSIIYAIPNAAKSTFGNASDIAYPRNATNLPPFCAVHVNVTSSPTSSFTFGLFLPEDWNGRFLAVGNGGFAGGINWIDMGSGMKYGFAVVSTDTGHNSTWIDGRWALNEPEKVLDWGHRAMHGSVTLAKTLVNAYYGKSIKYAYYSGCSTGGRQGLREIQLHPESFDGVLAGAPAWWTARLQTWTVYIGKLNLPATSPEHIPASLFPAISDEVMRQCDPADGVTDGIISDPFSCDFCYDALLCADDANSTTTCLTASQLITLKSIHTDYLINDTFIFPRLALGTETQWGLLLSSTTSPHPLGTDYVRNFLLNDPSWPWESFNASTIVPLADTLDPGSASATAYDLSPFRARGGKLMHYHGLADGPIPVGFSTYFYAQVARALGATNMDDWYRMFLIPGMHHCTNSDGNAPWYIAGAEQATTIDSGAYSVPGFEDEKHDALLALMAWVEEGRAPKEIVATKFGDDEFENGVVAQRAVCMFPGRARLMDQGRWVCGKDDDEEMEL